MTKKIQVKEKITSNLSFSEEVRAGLDLRPRRLSSKWFYDQRGDELFQQIMQAPEYYLTNCEKDIFQSRAGDFLAAAEGEPFDLIELGAGDGTKTQFLIEHFMRAGADFRYLPIDISHNALDVLSGLVRQRWPKLSYHPVQGDYFQALSQLPADEDKKLRRKMVLFPGANIGNFSSVEAHVFLQELGKQLAADDLLIIGFDLKKEPEKILAAYNDAGGVTRAFNLNLLRRINRELDADFDLSNWMHWPSYNPVTGATRSCIVSKCAQQVTIGVLMQTYSFEAWEAIDLEISQKYSKSEIEALAKATGFIFEQHLEDCTASFVDSVWRVVA